jgi:hypothetical protein
VTTLLHRRKFLIGLLAAPAIVHAGNLMPIKALPPGWVKLFPMPVKEFNAFFRVDLSGLIATPGVVWVPRWVIEGVRTAVADGCVINTTHHRGRAGLPNAWFFGGDADPRRGRACPVPLGLDCLPEV